MIGQDKDMASVQFGSVTETQRSSVSRDGWTQLRCGSFHKKEETELRTRQDVPWLIFGDVLSLGAGAQLFMHAV